MKIKAKPQNVDSSLKQYKKNKISKLGKIDI